MLSSSWLNWYAQGKSHLALSGLFMLPACQTLSTILWKIALVRRLQAIGVELDLSDKGLGVRSRRYAMLLDDGAVRLMHLRN